MLEIAQDVHSVAKSKTGIGSGLSRTPILRVYAGISTFGLTADIFGEDP